MTKAKETKIFYCEKYKELKTIVANKKIKFSNHQYSTSDVVVIKALEKMPTVEYYEDAMKKKAIKLDANTMQKLESSVRNELLKTMEKSVREELKKELEEEVRQEIEADIRDEITEEVTLKVKADLAKKSK